MSSDPQRYPIEPNVVSLVFELNALRVIQPCWSCEGHPMPGGAGCRAARVWFYAADPVYAVLLAQELASMEHLRLTRTSWQVTICPHSEDPDAVTFVIGPVQPPSDSLAEMHADLRAIGADLGSRLQRRAAAALISMG